MIFQWQKTALFSDFMSEQGVFHSNNVAFDSRKKAKRPVMIVIKKYSCCTFAP